MTLHSRDTEYVLAQAGVDYKKAPNGRRYFWDSSKYGKTIIWRETCEVTGAYKEYTIPQNGGCRTETFHEPRPDLLPIYLDIQIAEANVELTKLERARSDMFMPGTRTDFGRIVEYDIQIEHTLELITGLKARRELLQKDTTIEDDLDGLE